MKNRKQILTKNQNTMNVSTNFLIDYDDTEKWKAGLKEINSDYSKIVEMTEDAYNHFLNCLPPLSMGSNSFISSEPYRHNSEGKAVYIACIIKNDKYYAQMSTLSDYRLGKRFK